ncbi:hypothetical protein [Streptomyces sp. TS71-3]|uniref:hypothetical protein n=1 Tax=Streptomyces sp. TS71-3 TaxID=2733862 RepID=UPI001B2944B6|nr:hypothetical protein [Streptomyces sp. TS71-3]GHJ36365.1 lipoprotein [Streptomyces sp. TS71-3]
MSRTPLPPAVLGRPHRRTFLLGASGAAAGAVLTAGCTDDGPERAARERSATEKARARAARESSDLVGRYDAVLAAHPSLSSRLTPLRAEAVRHVAAFGGSPAPAPGSRAGRGAHAAASPGPSGAAPGPGTGAVAGTAPADAPAGEKDALTGLATTERALADRRMAALGGLPGEFARLLASVAAAGAAHAYLLTEGEG